MRWWATALVSVVVSTVVGVYSAEVGTRSAPARPAWPRVALIVILAPLPWLLAALGFLLPVWSIGAAPPMGFDALRAVVALVIIVRSRPAISVTARRSLRSWTVPLAALGALPVLAPALRGEVGVTGITMLVALGFAYPVAIRCSDPRPVWRGFAAGMVLSSLVAVSQTLGWDALSPQSLGNYRVTGQPRVRRGSPSRRHLGWWSSSWPSTRIAGTDWSVLRGRSSVSSLSCYPAGVSGFSGWESLDPGSSPRLDSPFGTHRGCSWRGDAPQVGFRTRRLH